LSYNVRYKDIGLRGYKDTWEYQETLFSKLADNKIHFTEKYTVEDDYEPGTLIIVEHPHVYTLGKHGSENNLLVDHARLRAGNAEFFRTDRGGDITYHGPGQVVGYPVFDLERVKIGLREYIHRLEEAIILTIRESGLSGIRVEGATGVWLGPDARGGTRKICAIGVKASRFITMHGFAFNVNTDLSYFNYINPCGFTDRGVTSLEKELGEKQDFENIKLCVVNNLRSVFDLNWIN